MKKTLLAALVVLSLCAPAHAVNEFVGATVAEIQTKADATNFNMQIVKLTPQQVAAIEETKGPQPIPGDLYAAYHVGAVVVMIVGADGRIVFSSSPLSREDFDKLLHQTGI